MMYTNGSSKLTPKERKEFMLDLCYALSNLKSPEEVADVLSDLFTSKEIETIAKRLKIAQHLVEGLEYETIRDRLKVGYSTISRVNTWLNLSGAGFKLMFARKRKKLDKEVSLSEKYDPFSWYNIKRRYSMNFWPQLVFDELLKSANRKEKTKIGEIFNKLDLKARSFSRKENKDLFQFYSGQFKKTKPPKKTKTQLK